MPHFRAIQRQLQMDAAVHRMLKEKGDDQTKIHTIDHCFLDDQEDSLKKLVALTKMLGYEPGEINSVKRADGSVRFSLYVKAQGATVPQLSARHSLLMLSLAETYGCTYDGWGTKVINKEQAAPASSADEIDRGESTTTS